LDDKVTILIIPKDNNQTFSFQLNADLVRNYRYILKLGVITLLIFFTFILGIFIYSLEVRNENHRLTSELSSLNQKIEYFDSLAIKSKLANIEGNITMINDYLVDRGILMRGDAGGESFQRQNKNIAELINYFETRSLIFYSTLRDLPAGLPSYGKVTSEYGYRMNPFGNYGGEFHSGIDFKGQIGEPVKATGDGYVEKAGWYGGYGNCVIINHNSGYQSLYGHLSEIKVSEGMHVKAGDLIGLIGSTGRSIGPHLHYEIRKNGEDVDPVPFLKFH